jgi:hypothetical protein
MSRFKDLVIRDLNHALESINEEKVFQSLDQICLNMHTALRFVKQQTALAVLTVAQVSM